MRHLPIFIQLLLIPAFLFAQVDKTQLFRKQVKSADTVLLISHRMIDGSTDLIIDSNRNIIALPQLIVDGNLNRVIIIEQKKITGKTLDKLLTILTDYNPKTIKEQGGCFVPRQSIIVIKASKVSYIDICFHCRSYETSKELENLPAIDFDQWKRLESFFRRQGLTYELDSKP